MRRADRPRFVINDHVRSLCFLQSNENAAEDPSPRSLAVTTKLYQKLMLRPVEKTV